MFERFNEVAIKAITVAQLEARDLGHGKIGPEHLFLGLVGANAGAVSETLKLKGISLDRARDEVTKLICKVTRTEPPLVIEFTDESKRALERGWEEAQKLGDDYYGPEHLLLGLIADTNGNVAKILEKFGETPCSMTQKIKDIDSGN